jgi:hypothetical protein
MAAIRVLVGRGGSCCTAGLAKSMMHLSNCNLSYTAFKLKKDSVHSVMSLLKDITNNMDLSSSDQIVRVLQYVADKQPVNGKLLDEIASLIENNMDNFTLNNYSAIIQCFIALRLKDDRNILEHIANRIVALLKDGKVKDQKSLADICWSFSVLNKWPLQLTPHLFAFIKDNFKLIKTQTLQIIKKSLRQAGVSPSQWLLYDATVKSPGIYKTARSVNQLNKVSHHNEEFCMRLKEMILTQDKSHWYSPRLVGDILWCLADLRYYDAEMMDVIADVIVPDVESLFPKNLSNIAYSYAYLNHYNHELLQAIVRRMVVLSKLQVDIFSLMKVVWSCLIADIYSKEFVELCFSDKVYSEILKNSRSGQTSFTQMIQLDIATRTEHPELSLPCLLPKIKSKLMSNSYHVKFSNNSTFHSNVLSSLAELFGNTTSYMPEAHTTSSYALDVEVLLDAYNRPIETPKERKEWSMAGLMQLYQSSLLPMDYSALKLLKDSSPGGEYNLSSDWCRLPDEVHRKMCIELDGPFHYAINSKHMLGRTVLKKRQLTALGWEVIQVRD